LKEFFEHTPHFENQNKTSVNNHISVCIPTFRRNQMLEQLLRKLAKQQTGGLFDYSVVVVDNDVAGTARETAIRLKEELALDLVYDIESERTIPAVRNHALRLARGNYIAIIDDDEFPPSDWLLNLYRAIQAYSVDGALGPVHPHFDQKPPDWLIKGKFCERPVHTTGMLLKWDQTRTGNVLIKREVFERHNLYFDPKFKTGGSDREFFKQAMQRGCKFVAVEEAPVYEIVPPERWAKSYWLKRALVNGYNSHRNSLDQMDGINKIILPVKSAGAVLAYALASPVCACLGSHVLMQCLERGCHHLSRLFAMMGIELVKRRDF
jgi:succinoglycan biosynthesis protein ExoM